MTWTLAHIFLLELAQELDIGTSLFLNPDSKPEPWENIFEIKDKFFKWASWIVFEALTNRFNFKVEYYYFIFLEPNSYIEILINY